MLEGIAVIHCIYSLSINIFILYIYLFWNTVHFYKGVISNSRHIF